MSLKIFTVIGARPQFIKAAPVGRVLREAGHQQFVVHTGQHYDERMSAVFFRELDIPEPDVNLEVGSGYHGKQTASMLAGIETLLIEQDPDWVLVYGDTNSTLAGALAATKLHYPLAHVEAGLRSFNKGMPEEVNRVITDHISDLLFCPTVTAMENLKLEGIVRGAEMVGDVMYDSVLYNLKLAEERSTILSQLKLTAKQFALATVHRAENTDHPERLGSILEALEVVAKKGLPVVMPLHPRTRKYLQGYNIDTGLIRFIEPVGYLDMLTLEKYAHTIFTDSGGVQKEAYWLEVPCVTLREETEWVETVQSGWNAVVGSDKEKILQEFSRSKIDRSSQDAYGDGTTAELIERFLVSA